MTKDNPNTVTLSAPVKIDGKDETKITLRKPKAGELRGLKLAEILMMDVATMIKLVPRISMPPLSEDQVADLEPEDLSALSTKVMTFFTSKAQAAQIQANL